MPVGSLSAHSRSSAARAAHRCACRSICSALKIERRPHGASLASQLPHLLQRAMACERGVASLGAWLECNGAAEAPASISSRAHKAVNYGLTDIGSLQQMWEPVEAGDAPRGRRSIWRALKIQRQAHGSPNRPYCLAPWLPGDHQSLAYRHPTTRPVRSTPPAPAPAAPAPASRRRGRCRSAGWCPARR